MTSSPDDRMQLTTKDQKELREFLLDMIPRFRAGLRKGINGAAAGNLFGLLWVTNRPLAKKVENWRGLSSAARDLHFVIEVSKNGGSVGAVVSEYIDLPQPGLKGC